MYSISERNGGQSVTTLKTGQNSSAADGMNKSECTVCVIPTDLGWFAFWGRNSELHGLTIGDSSADAAWDSIRRRGENASLTERDWNPTLRRLLQKFARGEVVDFSQVEIAHPRLTTFQRKVLDATRRIPYGETRTYSELASVSGHPRAARAVGTVMSNNRVPIIIPCHRVVASGGKWGGFSAPQGVSLKRRMLAIEDAGRET